MNSNPPPDPYEMTLMKSEPINTGCTLGCTFLRLKMNSVQNITWIPQPDLPGIPIYPAIPATPFSAYVPAGPPGPPIAQLPLPQYNTYYHMNLESSGVI
jgi:hypothetical protein